MSYADQVFISMCEDILENGTSTEGEKVRPHWPDGESAYTIKQFGVVNRYDLSKEFPALTLRKTYIKSAIDELLWIWQKKSNNVNDLKSHIWDEWADEDGSIGKAYGYQMGVKHQYKEGNDVMEEQRKNSYDPNEDIVDRMWKRSKNSINLVIVVCNILVFHAVTLTRGTESSRHMMDCGAAYAPLIESGEYYRLFTSMFLHFGIQHLINNMLLLLFLGDYLERAVGKIRYLVIYLGGGLVGNLCSYLHELSQMKTGEAPAVSAGASGAIFSAVGAMLVLLAFRKGRLEDLTFRRMAVMAILSLLVGFQSSNVDNFAHIGGFLAGAVLMAVLYPGMARIRKRGK